MIKTSEIIHKLLKNSKEYIDIVISLLRLEIAEKTSALLSSFFTIMIIALVFFSSLLFLGISIGLGLSFYTGSSFLGFFIVSVLYSIIGLLIWFKREKLIKLPVMNAILSNFFKKD